MISAFSLLVIIQNSFVLFLRTNPESKRLVETLAFVPD